MSNQVVDLQVSKVKFDREVDQFRRVEAMHRQRGWWLMSVVFPIVEIGFITPNLRPPALALCARLDFTNYDLWAPSV
jgi:Predicted metal binding domain